MDDSLLNGIVKGKLCGQGRIMKDKRFLGSTVDDLSHHVIPIIRKKPTDMIIYIGTKDAPRLTYKEIQDNLLKSKNLVTSM